MKAVIWTRYGPPEVLQLQEIPKPTPGDDEILIKVRATTVTAGDTEMRALRFPPWLSVPIRVYAGLTRPGRIRILGQELAGEVEAAGKDVTRFRPGDRVFASTGFGLGAYAEYKVLPENHTDGALVTMPENASFEEAAAVPVAGLEALHFIRRGEVGRGDRMLVIGAGGSIGTMAVQLGKHLGAEVTAVDSAPKLDMLRSIGADEVVDYKREDPTQRGETYDVIFDVIGASTYTSSMAALAPGGRYLLANPRLADKLRGDGGSRDNGRRVIAQTAEHRAEDLTHLRELMEAGVLKPVIGRTFPLEQAAEAHRYAETGQKLGNIVLIPTA